MARRFLQLALVLLVTTAVLTVFENAGVGVEEPPPLPDDISDRIVRNFEAAEASYLMWGRWVDLSSALLFSVLLVAAPMLPGVIRAKHLLVSGAAIAVVGEMIDLSKLVGFDVARTALDNDLAADFAAGNAFRFAVNTTSTYTWVAGVVLVGVGLLMVSVDTEHKEWGRASAMLGVAFAAMALTDINIFGTGGAFWVVSLVALVLGFYWILVALRVTETSLESVRAP